jgi:CHASE3 domain sensor protein
MEHWIFWIFAVLFFAAMMASFHQTDKNNAEIRRILEEEDS